MGKLQGSLKVIKCDSRGKNSTLRTLNREICSRAIDDWSIRSLSEGCSTAPCHQLPLTLPLRTSTMSRLTACPHQMRLSVLPLLEIGHDTVDDVRLWGEEVYGVDLAVGGPAVRDDLDIWSELDAGGPQRALWLLRILVTFSFKMVSSSMTLSISFRDSGSTTSTFHCARVIVRRRYQGRADGGSGVRRCA